MSLSGGFALPIRNIYEEAKSNRQVVWWFLSLIFHPHPPNWLVFHFFKSWSFLKPRFYRYWPWLKWMSAIEKVAIDQLAKPTFRSRYAHTPMVTEQREGPMDTVAFTTWLAGLQMSHIMRKPVYAICEQQRRRLACASAQSDQRLCFRCLDSIISLLAIAEISRP